MAFLTANAQLTLPPAADSISLTPSGVAWTYSSWVEITASMPVAAAITGITFSAPINVQFKIQVGVGGAGSETVIGTVIGQKLNTEVAMGYLRLPVPADLVSNGARVSVRLAQDSTSTTAWLMALTYMASSGTFPKTTAVSDAFAPVSVTPNGSAWANSAWVQVTASASSALALAAVQPWPDTPASYEIDVGIGAVSSEVVVHTYRGSFRNADFLGGWTTAGGWCVSETAPLAPAVIPTGARIAIRIRKSDTDTTAWPVQLGYVPVSGTETDIQPTTGMKWWPPAADRITLTAPGGWAAGSWVQLTASATAASAIAAANVDGSLTGFELEIGKGAPGSEVVVATFHGNTVSLAGTQSTHISGILVSGISSGDRVAARVKLSHSVNVQVSVGYYETPFPVAVTTLPNATWPATDSQGLSATSPFTAWLNGAWQQLEAATAAATYLTGIGAKSSEIADFEIDIGLGAAAVETVLTTFRARGVGGQIEEDLPLAVPTFIPSGSRVSARFRKSIAGATGFTVHAKYSQPAPGEVVFDAADDIAGDTIGLTWVEFQHEI